MKIIYSEFKKTLRMNILIFGASGATGHELVGQALALGHQVTAFVRNPSKLKIAHQNLRIVQGDVVNSNLVEQAVKHQDAVLSALGAASPFKYDAAVVDGIENIITAMETAGISRFIYLSSSALKDCRNNAGFVIKYIVPKILATEVAGHQLRENRIEQSRLQWTILRPPTLTNGKHKGGFRTGEDIFSKGFTVTISRADVADCMLRQLTDNTFIKRKLLVMY